jgi:septal ring factor EnvC (AmiA/AmiB activator)
MGVKKALENQISQLETENQIISKENQLLESSKAKLKVQNKDQKDNIEKLEKLCGVTKKKKK